MVSRPLLQGWRQCVGLEEREDIVTSGDSRWDEMHLSLAARRCMTQIEFTFLVFVVTGVVTAIFVLAIGISVWIALAEAD